MLCVDPFGQGPKYYWVKVPNIIGSCVVLHIYETCGDHWSDEGTVEEGSHISGGGTPTTATTQLQQDELQESLTTNSYD